MKVERVSEHIWSLRIWVLIPVRVWLVKDGKGITLVDAGVPSMAPAILREIERLDAGELQRILLTHGHSDHVGAIQGVRRSKQVPVYAHAVEIPYMEGKLAYPRRKKAVPSVEPGLAKPLAELEDGRFEPTGGLVPYLTPGHSPGHVAYYHEEDEVLLAGDLFTSKKGTLRRPMAIFTADMSEAVHSGRLVGELAPKRLEICHGGPVIDPAGQLDFYLRESKAYLASKK